MSVRPRTKPAAVRRGELLDAAERLFLANGVQATSVDAIVAAADMAKGTFYLHFAAKEAVVGALRERFVVALRDAVATAMNRRAVHDFTGRLEAWVAAFAGDLLARSALHAIVFDTQIAPVDDRHENLTADVLAELLAAGTAAGAFDVPDPRFTAALLFHAAHGAVHEADAAGSTAGRKRLIAALTRFFRRAVAAS